MLLTLLFAIGLAEPDLRLELVRESLTGTHYRYRQHIDGQPVLGGEVNVTVRHSGAREEHRVLAMPPFGPRFKSAGTTWVNAGGIARQARRTVVSDGVLPAVRYIDVETGHILREDRLYWNAKAARVFDANPVAKLNAPELRDMQDSPAAVPAIAYENVQLLGVNAAGPLGGPWVQIADFQSPFIAPAEASGSLVFERSDDGFEDVNAYFHIDRSQRHLQALGYVGPRSVAAYPLETDTHAAAGTDNSFFVMSLTTAGEGRLYFGEGGTDDAEDSDLIVHEYAHAIHEWISPATFLGSFDSETRAVSEGFGDYWAFSAEYAATKKSGRDPFCLADWDARCWEDPPGEHCGYPEGADCLRRMDSSKTVADLLIGNSAGTEHRNGEIWSAALTRIFLALVERYGDAEGRRIADITILESLFGAPPAPGFAAIARRMIAADRFVSGGRNSDVICAEMTRRGILSDCNTVPRGEITVIPGTGSGIVVPDNDPAGVTLSAFVSDTRPIEKVMVAVNIRHRGRGELRVQLIAPDGTTIRLYEPAAERAPDLVTTFGGDAAPVDSLDVLRGRSANGEWKLRVIDVAFADLATVISWSLMIQFAGDEPLATRPAAAGERQIVPIAGRTPGVNATFFSTDLRMLNPSSRDVEAMLIFTPSVADGTVNFAAVRVIVPPGHVFASDDVVRSLFGTAGTGQLEIIGDVIASTRTWTSSGAGTSGFSAPAVASSSAIGAGEASHVFHLRNDEKFRSNIGFAEVDGKPTRVVVRINGENSSYTVFPFSHLQVPVLSRGDILHAEITVEGEGRVIAYGATIDQLSRDAVYLLRSTCRTDNLVCPGLAPAISSPGALGTHWRTELAVGAPATLKYTTAGETITRHVSVSQRYEDAIATLFNRPGTIGTLSAEGFVSARVWTDGTYGQAVPFAAPSDQRDQYILHVENSSAYRTNIGLLTDVDSTVRVTLFDGDGLPLDVDEHRVPALEVIQFPVEQPVTNGYVLVEVLDGRVYAYGSLVDNRTGDPAFIPAQ